MAGGKMTEKQVRLIICLACTGLWILEMVVFAARIKLAKNRLESSGKAIPPAEPRLLMILIVSVIVIVLPFLIWFESFFVTCVIEGCGVMATFLGLKERLDALKNS